MGKRVNKRELSEFLGFSERTLTEWQEAGMPIEERGDRGEANVYDTEAVVRWLLARESGKDRAESERERLTRLQADQIELDMAMKRRTLVAVDEVEPAYQRLVASAKSFLRSQAVPLVQSIELLQGEEAKVQLVTERFDEFLSKLSRPDLTDDLELADAVVEGPGPAAEAEPRPLG